MAAPTFDEARAGGTDAGGDWTTNSTIFGGVGQVVILQVLQDGATAGAVALTSATNVSNLAGTANSMDYIGAFPIGSSTAAYQHLWIGRQASVTCSAGGTNSTSEDLYYRWYTFLNVSAGTTLATVIENSTAGSTANTNATNGTITDAGVTTLGPDRLALQFIGISDDNALAAFTGETGGNWTEAVDEYAESSGTDATIGLQTSWISTLGVAPGDVVLGGEQSIHGGTGTSEQQAQQFTTGGSGLTVTHVYASLSKSGTPSDNLVVEIQTDSSGVPSGTVVGSSGSIACSSLTTSPLTYRIAVSATLSSSTVYHLVFRRDGARDTSNFPRILQATSGTSSDDAAARNNGTWTGGGINLGCALLTSTDVSGGTVNGGTTTNSDATDGWGVVGFALIGTTPSYQPRYGFVHYNDPGLL